MRLDIYLKEIIGSRAKAQEQILQGKVRINGKVIKKASYNVKDSYKVEIERGIRFVSRAALKLLHAKEEFGIDFREKTVLDVGSSTGGFSQVALLEGVKKIYAVDIGTNQMHESLRDEPRIAVFENCDARLLNQKQIKEKADIILVDLSFISTLKVLPNLIQFLKEDGEIIWLFKPQFELGKEKLKKGIAKSEADIEECLTTLNKKLAKINLKLVSKTKSPIKGKKGNQEYLLLLKKS